MTDFRVTWDIDVEADDPVQAAKLARLIQLDPQSTATVFTVRNKASGKSVDVDLELAP
jgi:hypothetical protein